MPRAPCRAKQPLLDLARGDAAEVEVGGEPRRPVAPERVVVVLVVARPDRRESGRGVLCASDSPPAAGSSTSCFRPSDSRLGSRPFASFEGSGGISRGAPSTSRRSTPSQFWWNGAEDGVRLALLGADVAELVDRAQSGVIDRLDARGLEGRAAELPALATERADLAGEMDGLRAGLLRDRGDLPLGLAVADHQARAALAEFGVELAEALQKELGPRTRLVAAVEQPVVEAEDRNDALVAVERRAQRRMVADPQVATKPDDAGPASGHEVNLPAGAQVKRATSATALAGASRRLSGRARELAPCARTTPQWTSARGRHGRASGQRQLALGADQGAARDHLGSVTDEPALELSLGPAYRSGRGAVFTRVAVIGLKKSHCRMNSRVTHERDPKAP